MTRPTYLPHTANPLGSWGRAQHAQGMCEAWVAERPAAFPEQSHACRNRAKVQVWTEDQAWLRHLCGVHAARYIGAINRQHAGAVRVRLRGQWTPLPEGLKWCYIGGQA